MSVDVGPSLLGEQACEHGVVEGDLEAVLDLDRGGAFHVGDKE